MEYNWIIFGGWAYPPQLLEPLFGQGACYLDSNTIVSSFINEKKLSDDWRRILYEKVKNHLTRKPYAFCGWSMGSLLAAGLCSYTEPECVCMISATPSFCRRQGFRYGVNPALLKKMQTTLQTDLNGTLQDFFSKSDPGAISSLSTSYSLRQLSAGLLFLEHATLLPQQEGLGKQQFFFHGNQDSIISSRAGRYFSEQVQGEFFEFSGGHTFFLSHYLEIKKILKGE